MRSDVQACFVPNTDPPVGFSVDLWNEVARRMHAGSPLWLVNAPYQLLPAVQGHEADVAIGAIAITPEGEQLVDFSVPYFDSGLRIMVRAQYEGGIISTLKSIPWVAIGYLLLAAISILVLTT